jgi:hypothetical protein
MKSIIQVINESILLMPRRDFCVSRGRTRGKGPSNRPDPRAHDYGLVFYKLSSSQSKTRWVCTASEPVCTWS